MNGTRSYILLPLSSSALSSAPCYIGLGLQRHQFLYRSFLRSFDPRFCRSFQLSIFYTTRAHCFRRAPPSFSPPNSPLPAQVQRHSWYTPSTACASQGGYPVEAHIVPFYGINGHLQARWLAFSYEICHSRFVRVKETVESCYTDFDTATGHRTSKGTSGGLCAI